MLGTEGEGGGGRWRLVGRWGLEGGRWVVVKLLRGMGGRRVMGEMELRWGMQLGGYCYWLIGLSYIWFL